MNRITNGTLPDAQSYAINFDVVVAGGADITSHSKLTMLSGPDRGKSRLLADAGLAVGLDVGVSVVLTNYYYTGNSNNLTLNDFNGFRFSGSIGMSAYLELGGGLSIAKTKSGHFIIGVSKIVGMSPPGPSGNFNVGFTDYYKK
ncbi:hypothetical protein N7E81_18955 [Reichenbachiella carrageenanivorans]|uniref:Uncharacterized protein n=1 Tax=Reichenbachiella carrageenanivorans TaxID=2979869 RepID=A0ABY6D010_9BACT|nr:hypothetical protein [Reichenbachiella carrageenanivorans]UXX79433.1 hypothetical protein N7E81_18955 [Reichenbachiella carrageenanivorans]